MVNLNGSLCVCVSWCVSVLVSMCGCVCGWVSVCVSVLVCVYVLLLICVAQLGYPKNGYRFKKFFQNRAEFLKF